jgi:hypothetical protein
MRAGESAVEDVGCASNAYPTPSRVTRVAGACLLAFLSGVSSGCYVYAPVSSSPAPGTSLVLGLNDQGRVALGPSVGPSAQTVLGTLRSRNDSSFDLAVNSVVYLNGQSNKWSGEPLVVPTNLVQDTKQIQFSRGRTTATVALAAAALLGFAVSRGLFASQSPARDRPIPPPVDQ